MMLFSNSEKAEYEAQEFKGLTFNNGQIDLAEFNTCTFVKCTLRETIFNACKFRDCTFKSCDLSLIKLNKCSLVETTFEDSQLVGINWTEALWPSKFFFKTVDFYRCALNHSTFMGLNLKKVTFKQCVAHDVDFSEANLSQSNCTYTDFSNSRFFHTNLSEADFSGASQYAIAPVLNTLKKTRFSLPEAMALLYGLDIVLTEADINIK